MKKLIFPIVCCFISVTVSAQLIKPKAETQKKQSELDWFTVLRPGQCIRSWSKTKLMLPESQQKESKEKTGCCTDRNRNGRRTRRPKTRNLESTQKKSQTKKMMIKTGLLTTSMAGTSSVVKTASNGSFDTRRRTWILPVTKINTLIISLTERSIIK